MNCTRCLKWTEEPDAVGLCRGCHDYANCTYPVEAVEGRARDWKAEAEWATAVHKAKTERLDAYILTIGTIRKTIDMWRNKATASGDAMVQVFEAIDKLDEHWSQPWRDEAWAEPAGCPVVGASCRGPVEGMGHGHWCIPVVHPSNLRTVVDVLEDDKAGLRNALGRAERRELEALAELDEYRAVLQWIAEESDVDPNSEVGRRVRAVLSNGEDRKDGNGE